MRVLLDQGADPNARWGTGDRFPLFEAIHAAEYGYVRPIAHRDEIVRLLLLHGADPNARYCPYESRGYQSSSWLDTTEPRTCTNELAMTPLMGAAAYGYAAVVYRLLDAGARPLDQNWFGGTALDMARDEFTYRLILAAAYPGPDADRRAAEELLNRQHVAAMEVIRADGQGRIDPAYYAGSEYGRVRLLITAARMGGASDTEMSTWLNRRLHDRWDRLDRLTLLLENGADANVRRCSNLPTFSGEPDCTAELGTTLLMEASYYAGYWDDAAAIDLLQRYGADPALRDWRSRTAADYRLLGEALRREHRRQGIGQWRGALSAPF